MDKVTFIFELPKNKTIEYNGNKFEITPFIKITEQIALIRKYIEDYTSKEEKSLISESPYNYLEAEYNLMTHLLQACTNISLEDLDNNVYGDACFWELIYSEIINYKMFRQNLENAVREIKAKDSFEYTIGGLIKKASELFDKIAQIDPEDLKKLSQENAKLIEKLEEKSVLGK